MNDEDYRARVIESHNQAVARGEHDEQCEWRPGGFWICNCSKRQRERAGFIASPGPLIHQYPICPRCNREVYHDGDSLTCERCKAHWDESGQTAEFYDDHGDLTADLAEWEAAYAAKEVAS